MTELSAFWREHDVASLLNSRHVCVVGEKVDAGVIDNANRGL